MIQRPEESALVWPIWTVLAGAPSHWRDDGWFLCLMSPQPWRWSVHADNGFAVHPDAADEVRWAVQDIKRELQSQGVSC